MPRDISRAEYVKRMKAHGFKSTGGVMGYWELPNSSTCVSEWNGGETWRGRLAYMIREAEKEAARRAATGGGDV